MRRREFISGIAGAAAAWPQVVGAQQLGDPNINIGVLTDMSGLFATLAGAGSVAAAEMAVQDFGGEVLGKKIRSGIISTRSTSLLPWRRSGLTMNTLGRSSICRTRALRWPARSGP